ncbi:MAG: sigma-70 family RNA polymerase sigma factor [Acidobacteriota bacterium]
MTKLLQGWQRGDSAARDALLPLVYSELYRLARAQAGGDRQQTLQPTALVHETFLKLASGSLDFQDRVHFFAFSARVMRSVLVDHARAQQRQKRGGSFLRVSWDKALKSSAAETPQQVLDLDEALQKLERIDPRKCRVIELRYFAGLEYEESAEFLGVSKTTVNRELRLARAWLQAELAEPAD